MIIVIMMKIFSLSDIYLFIYFILKKAKFQIGLDDDSAHAQTLV